MNIFKLFCVAAVSISLVAFFGCSKKKDEDISADEIIDEAEKETADTSMAETAKPPAEAEKPAAAEPSYQPRFSESGRYVVQVRAYPSETSAKRFMQTLLDKGYPSYVAQVDNPTPDLTGSYFRVRIGGFDAISDAREFGEKVLVSLGFQYWVDNKSNDNVGKGAGSEMGGSSYPSSSPAPSYSAPAPSYSAPAPEPAPSYSAPAPEPAPAYTAPAPEPAPAPAPAPAAPAPAPSGGGSSEFEF